MMKEQGTYDSASFDGHSSADFGSDLGIEKSKGDTTSNVESQGVRRAVSWSRVFFFFVLALAAAGLAFIVYYRLSEEEDDDFQAALQNLGSEFVLLSNQNARTVLSVLQGLSLSATSLIKLQQEQRNQPGATQYPASFLTMPDAVDQLDLARNSTGALVIAYQPLVAAEDYNQWLEYANDNKGWIAEGNNVDVDSTEVEIFPDIWEWQTSGGRRLEEEDCPGGGFRRQLADDKVKAAVNVSVNDVMAPVWTMSPVPSIEDAGPINFNLLTKGIYKKAVDFTIYSSLPAFLDVCYQSLWFDVETPKEVLQTVIASPVFDTTNAAAQVVGHFVSVVPWVSQSGAAMDYYKLAT